MRRRSSLIGGTKPILRGLRSPLHLHAISLVEESVIELNHFGEALPSSHQHTKCTGAVMVEKDLTSKKLVKS